MSFQVEKTKTGYRVTDSPLMGTMISGNAEGGNMRQLEQGTVGSEVLAEIRQWMEHVSVALGEPGVHGLNVTAMRQANAHLISLRTLMGATSTERPDDRPSAWPEGEGIDPLHPQIDGEAT